MNQDTIKNSIKLFPVFLLMTSILFAGHAFAEDIDKQNELFANAEELFLKGEYIVAIKTFDEILEIEPKNYKILEMKGLALSNLRLGTTLASQAQQAASFSDPSILNKLSMLEFYKVLEINPNSILALNGMGIGFGNFGEYTEAERYFEKSLKINPNNEVTENYLSSIERLKTKYSLNAFENPTKKPPFLLQSEENIIPDGIKNNAGWWSDDKITDHDFISGIEYLIENNMINVNATNYSELLKKDLEIK